MHDNNNPWFKNSINLRTTKHTYFVRGVPKPTRVEIPQVIKIYLIKYVF